MFEHPTGKVPEKVVVMAMGPTRKDFLDILAQQNTDLIDYDEVWGVNNACNVTSVDLNFIIDDYRYLVPYVPSVATIMRTSEVPTITSVAPPDLPNAVSFPLAEVLAMPGARDYLNHTVAYIFAYAALIGVKELIIFGADYITTHERYGTRNDEGWQMVARYMSCASYWLGLCAARGMDVVVTPTSPLLGADRTQRENLYGYLIPPKIQKDYIDGSDSK